MRDRDLTRARFLKLLAACGVGAGVAPFLPGFAARADAPAAVPKGEPPVPDAETLVRVSVVVDGLFSPRRAADDSWPVLAGEIKRLTGVDAGFWDVGDPTKLDDADQLIEAHRTAAVKVERTDDVGLARASGRVGLIYYGSRNWNLGGSLEPLAGWRAGGLRALQLTREGENEIGGGFDRDEAPLTAFGKRVVAELNRTKTLIDVSHCGRRTTLDAASTSTAPVAALHANPRKLADHDRNKSDEEIAAIAGTGGVVAVSVLGRYLRPSFNAQPSIRDYVAQIDHVVQLAGIDHVAVASDTWIDGRPLYPYDAAGPVLNAYKRWFSVAAAFLARGYGVDDVRKVLGQNLLRVLRETIG